jgi:hypothetical protein
MTEPGKGVHAHHFLGVATFDFVLTIIGAALASYLWSIPLSITVIGFLLLGIASHYAFGIETSVIVWLRNVL